VGGRRGVISTHDALAIIMDDGEKRGYLRPRFPFVKDPAFISKNIPSGMSFECHIEGPKSAMLKGVGEHSDSQLHVFNMDDEGICSGRLNTPQAREEIKNKMAKQILVAFLQKKKNSVYM
jgi:hypothetical protein